MPLDPRTPVIVGVAQLRQRDVDPADALEPAALMAEALEQAASDAGSRAALDRAQSVRVVGLVSWGYGDVGRAIAARLGIEPAESLTTATGGNSPQMLVTRTAADIQRGAVDVALVVSAETVSTRLRAAKAGVFLPWTPLDRDGAKQQMVIGEERPGLNDIEQQAGLEGPTSVYPLFENAIRAARGERVDEHQRRIATLWSRFSEVAATNPVAWQPEAFTPDELATPSPDNRPIAFPYTKLLTANIQTDQAAALIMCSAEAASSLGIERDRWVFPLAGADAYDHWWVSSRRDLHSSPAIGACGRGVSEGAGVPLADVTHVDLYSCFPSAVQVAAAELGLAVDDPARPLTVTGGLTFAGGPANGYVTHSIAAVASRIREHGGTGLTTAVGWYLTKHAAGLYGAVPPAGGFRAVDAQSAADADAGPPRPYVAASDAAGATVTVESVTVIWKRDGTADHGVAACLLPDGTRTWWTTHDADECAWLTTDDAIGSRLTLSSA
jgi:acetyl-CoA C-acetyltransferase